MRQLFICSLALLSVASVNAQTKKAPVKTPIKTTVAKTSPMKNLLDSFSYAVGLNIASNMKQQGITTVNASMVQKALDDSYQNRAKLLSDEKAGACLQEQLMIFQQTKALDDHKKSAGEKTKGEAFLKANKARKEITTLADGLQYEVIKAGDPNGIKPTAADTVVVHYAGTLIDGTKFDNSYDRGEPATFPVGGVIRGWTEILQLMPKGAVWKVYIPSDLAYGDRGAGAAIPPGATLVFEINLLDVKPVAKN
jgi:FKBP-type peptidyl-prolyl cis-trans isomerase FklB